MVVKQYNDRWTDSAGGAGKLDTIKAPHSGDWQDITPVLNRLGRDGWELVGVASSGSDSYARYVLKRASSN